jgi:FMN-dependent NADH-azoreductase
MTKNTASENPLRLLHVNASGRYEGSVSRDLSTRLVDGLRERIDGLQVQERDVATGLPFVDAGWISANFTPDGQRTPEQQQQLAQSTALVQELQDADIIVIAAPVYNFSIPASLKAWIDMVARAGLTFRYSEDGPVGLLQNKKAYLVLASGGTPIGSDIDFASGYLRHVLGFIGIDDVTIIAAERLMQQADAAVDTAEQQIRAAVEGLNMAA